MNLYLMSTAPITAHALCHLITAILLVTCFVLADQSDSLLF